MANETAGLRGAVHVRVATWSDRTGIVLQRGCHVADSGQAEARNRWVLCLVCDFVRQTRPHTGLQANGVRIWDDRSVFLARELPLVSRNQPRRRENPFALRQTVLRVVEIERRVRAGVVPAGVRVRERRLVGNKPHPHPAGDRLAVVGGNRRVEPDKSSALGDVELPANGDERVALVQQIRVAEVGFTGGIGRPASTAERAEQLLVPAVHDVEEDDAVTARGILRLDDVEVGGELHLPLGILRCFVEVDDDLVVRVVGVDREVNRPDELFVRPDLAERLAAKHVLASLDVNPRDLRGARSRREKQK